MAAPIDEMLVDRIAEGTRRGESAELIAERLGVSARTVVRWRKRLGIGKKRSALLTDEQIAVARTLLESGASYRIAAQHIGCNADHLRVRIPGRGRAEAGAG
ncbi:helix-turn-helix domain-containing protein [Gordonia sp. SND2]|uniref:helix-turn-helix domain-containing protein n=1 Tax=Gordonia sp. SND2 TaxID=3388659 RepID=UPI00398B4F77